MSWISSPLAGFQVITIGRFWVITKDLVRHRAESARAANQGQLRLGLLAMLTRNPILI